MALEERLVAVVSPWERLNEVVKRGFRVESLPAEKLVMIWRDDLQSKEQLESELKAIGVKLLEIRTKKITARWQEIE